MKKILLCILIVLFNLVSCSSDDETKQNNSFNYSVIHTKAYIYDQSNPNLWSEAGNTYFAKTTTKIVFDNKTNIISMIDFGNQENLFFPVDVVNGIYVSISGDDKTTFEQINSTTIEVGIYYKDFKTNKLVVIVKP